MLWQWIPDELEAVVIEYSTLPYLIIENFFPNDLYHSIVTLDPFNLVAGMEKRMEARA